MKTYNNTPLDSEIADRLNEIRFPFPGGLPKRKKLAAERVLFDFFSGRLLIVKDTGKGAGWYIY